MEWWVWISWWFLFSGLTQIFNIMMNTLKKEHDIYVNKINNRLVSKIKDTYKLELQILKRWSYLAAQKKLINKAKNEKNVPS